MIELVIHVEVPLGQCQNPDCRKLFIEAKSDQKYCSPECAKPSILAAKRKWWDENRGKKVSK